MLRFDWWSVGLIVVVLVLLAAALPFLSASAECHAVCTPVAAGGNCNCDPAVGVPISEDHFPAFYAFLPFVGRPGRAGVGL